jgi:hypothetical protein
MHIRRYHGGGNDNDEREVNNQNRILNSARHVQKHSKQDDEQELMEWGEEENQNDYNDMDDDDDEDQKEMRTMEEMEYLEYQNRNEFNKHIGKIKAAGGLQLTISCESCGLEIDACDIAEHICSSKSPPEPKDHQIIKTMNQDGQKPEKSPVEKETKKVFNFIHFN